MTPVYHAMSTVNKFGGEIKDYVDIHNWLDETKQYTGDWTHRAFRHHSAGVQWCIQEFGHMITNSDGVVVPVKMIAEQHIIEDCGFIPKPSDWLNVLAKNPENWMLKVKVKSKNILNDTNNNTKRTS